MNPIKILIADDDAGMRLVMRKLVDRAEGYQLAGEAEGGDRLIALYDETRPDVVLMDVEMPGMTGIECAHAIQDRDPKTVLVFATAHEEYMKHAFEVYAFDYLVKPFSVDRALNTLKLIRERLTQTQADAPRALHAPAPRAVPDRLMLKHREGMSFLSVESILLIQREERSTVIYTDDGERYVTSETLSDLEKRLSDKQFIRTHKSYLVNLSAIDSITPYGRWTYVVKLRGTKHDALITHERFEELQAMFI